MRFSSFIPSLVGQGNNEKYLRSIGIAHSVGMLGN